MLCTVNEMRPICKILMKDCQYLARMFFFLVFKKEHIFVFFTQIHHYYLWVYCVHFVDLKTFVHSCRKQTTLVTYLVDLFQAK